MGNKIDEIEVIDLEQYNADGRPIPNKGVYYLVRVDKEKIRVKMPVTAEEILIAAGKNPEETILYQKFHKEEIIELQLKDEVDLSQSGVESFVTELKEQKVITIVVNGREKELQSKKTSFLEIVALAFTTPPSGNNVVFTVTFYNGPKKNPEGSMVEGSIVKIKEGMVFNVTSTDKS